MVAIDLAELEPVPSSHVRKRDLKSKRKGSRGEGDLEYGKLLSDINSTTSRKMPKITDTLERIREGLNERGSSRASVTSAV